MTGFEVWYGGRDFFVCFLCCSSIGVILVHDYWTECVHVTVFTRVFNLRRLLCVFMELYILL